MGKLHSNVKKYVPDQKLQRKVFGEKNYDTVHFLGSGAEKARNAAKAAEQATRDAENEPVMPLADEAELARNKKKGLGRRNRGRSSTILSDSETLG